MLVHLVCRTGSTLDADAAGERHSCGAGDSKTLGLLEQKCAQVDHHSPDVDKSAGKDTLIQIPSGTQIRMPFNRTDAMTIPVIVLEGPMKGRTV